MVYLNRNGIRERFKIHRLVCSAFLPNPENKPYVDHIDGDIKNNRLDNLRWSTNSENQANQKPLKKNKSGFRGLQRRGKTADFWEVSITHNNKKRYIGSYTDINEAALAYNREAIKCFGEYARLNQLQSA